MKTTLNTRTSLFHIMISIVVTGLLFSVNLTMAEDSSTSPSDKILETKKPSSEFPTIMKLVDLSPDGCTLYVDKPELSGVKHDPSKPLVIKLDNPSELKITAVEISAHRTKDQIRYRGDVIITTSDYVIKTQEANAVSENQKLTIKIKSARIKKLRS